MRAGEEVNIEIRRRIINLGEVTPQRRLGLLEQLLANVRRILQRDIEASILEDFRERDTPISVVPSWGPALAVP